MTKIDPAAQRRADTKRTTGLPTEALMWLTPHGMSGMGEDGKLGGGGEFAKQVHQWGTPQARDYRSPDSPDSPDYQRKLREGYTIDLNSQASAWPTPKATDGTKGGSNQAGSKGDLMLPSAAANWPTPTVRDHKGGGLAVTRPDGKSRMDMLDWRAEAFSRQDPLIPSGATSSTEVLSVHGAELSPTTRPAHVLGRQRLNPAFGCWLMGWPSWWTNPGTTNFARLEMVSYRSKLQSQLSSLLGERDSSNPHP